MNILVTGGAGYLGSVLTPRLLNAGHAVRLIDRLLFGRAPIEPLLSQSNLTFLQGDITNLEAYPGLFDGIDAVIHLAALSNDPSCDLRPGLTESVNYRATLDLAERARRAGVRRFLLASSCSVYGAGVGTVTEDSPLRPVSLYAESKVKAERGLLDLAGDGFSVTCLRQATLYGLSPRMRFDLAINLMVMHALTKGEIFVLGGGKQWRPFLHLIDAARAFEMCLTMPKEAVDGQIFNVGSEEQNYQIDDLARLVQEELGASEVDVEVVPDDADKRSYRVSFAKIAQVLGFKPTRWPQDGIREIAQAIRRGDLGDCSDPRWYNIKTIKAWYERPACLGGVPVRQKFLPFALPLLGREEEDEVLDTLRSGWLTTGPKTQRFEKMLADYLGAAHVIAVNSCTAALHLSLAALDIGPGDQVITSPVTWASTANVVVHQGAEPVFVDVDPKTLNLDPTKLKTAITSKTKAIIPVHMAGQPCRMDEIYRIAGKYNLHVVEDAAHAIGAEYRGCKIGALPGSTTACFSFYPIKNITTIEGGAVATSDAILAEKIRQLSLHGLSRNAWKRYAADGPAHPAVLYPGFKYNMTDVQAALGLHQLPQLEKFRETRQRYAEMYHELLSHLPEITPLQSIPNIRHAWHLFIVLLDLDRLTIDRDQFITALRAENIGTGIHFVSLHLHPYYRETFGLQPNDFPNAADISERVISLPMYPKMSEFDINDVVEALTKIIIAYRKK